MGNGSKAVNEICQTEVCARQAKACEQHFLYIEKVIGVKFEAIDKAMSLAAEEIQRRMHESNGLRQQMEKQNDTFVDVSFYRMEHANLAKEIEILRDWKNIQVGKAATNNLLSALALLISFVVAVLHFFPGLR